MLRDLLMQMQTFRERISKEVGYRCDIEVRMLEHGLEFIVFSKLNTLDMHYYSQVVSYQEIVDSVNDDNRFEDEFVFYAKGFFTARRRAACRHRWVIGDVAISDPARMTLLEQSKAQCGLCSVWYMDDNGNRPFISKP